MIDIGANLADRSFERDLNSVIERAICAGIQGIVVTGTDLENSKRAAEISARNPLFLYSTAGIHPHQADDAIEGWDDRLIDFVARYKVVAIGETGLDFFRDFSGRDKQIEVFRRQIEIARRTNLPLFVHDRQSQGEVLRSLKELATTQVVVHCFTGSEELLKAYLEIDCYIGITGWICDERRGRELCDAVPLVPDDRLLVETDSPYLLPRTIRQRVRGRRNEPMYLPYVVERLAEVRKQTSEEVSRLTTANARRFFGLN